MGNHGGRRQNSAKEYTPPSLEFLFACSVVMADPIEVVPLSTGQRLVVPIEPGGRIEGPRMHGEILPGSISMHFVRPDRVVEFEGHLFFEMDDGERILARSTGLLSAPDTLADCWPYDPSALYACGFVRFEAGHEGLYAWLNQGLYITKGERTMHGAKSTFWKIS